MEREFGNHSKRLGSQGRGREVCEASTHQESGPWACAPGARLPRGQAAPNPRRTAASLADPQLPARGSAGLGEEAGHPEARAGSREVGRGSEASPARGSTSPALGRRVRRFGPALRGPRAGFTYPSGSPEVCPGGIAARTLFRFQPRHPSPPRPGSPGPPAPAPGPPAPPSSLPPPSPTDRPLPTTQRP